MPTFFIPAPSIIPPTIRITEPLLRHLRDSLRLQPGEPLTLTDYEGMRYRTEIVQVTPKAIEARILETESAPAKASPTVVLAQALLKGEKMDWVIQKSTELGIGRLVPLLARHSVMKLKQDRVDHQRARWERIALEAAQQSERWDVPVIEEPATLPELLTRYADCESKHILAERSTADPLNRIPLPTNADTRILLMIGPEGGWDETEINQAMEQGCRPLTMGLKILRAETAAIAAISIVQARLGELG